jgi:hypothetical protein
MHARSSAVAPSRETYRVRRARSFGRRAGRPSPEPTGIPRKPRATPGGSGYASPCRSRQSSSSSGSPEIVVSPVRFWASPSTKVPACPRFLRPAVDTLFADTSRHLRVGLADLAHDPLDVKLVAEQRDRVVGAPQCDLDARAPDAARPRAGHVGPVLLGRPELDHQGRRALALLAAEVHLLGVVAFVRVTDHEPVRRSGRVHLADLRADRPSVPALVGAR